MDLGQKLDKLWLSYIGMEHQFGLKSISWQPFHSCLHIPSDAFVQGRGKPLRRMGPNPDPDPNSKTATTATTIAVGSAEKMEVRSEE